MVFKLFSEVHLLVSSSVNIQENPLDQHIRRGEPGEGAGDDWLSGPGRQHAQNHPE